MQYLLMIYNDEAEIASATPETIGPRLAAYHAYGEAMGKAGVVLGGNRLRPTNTATTVRIRDGKTQVLDGPYADTKEQLGGYYLIEAENLDQAVAIAARIPSARFGSIEVRPIMKMG